MVSQWILYNQLNKNYCYDDVDSYIFLLSQTTTCSPYGKLQFNKFSQDIEKKASKHFFEELSEGGQKAIRSTSESYYTGLLAYCKEYKITTIVVMNSNEPSLVSVIKKIKKKLSGQGIDIQIRDNTQFLISCEEFQSQFSKPPVMETFYRWMRKKLDILMEGSQPIGGKWNYDSENRSFDKKYNIKNTHKIIYPVTRKQALEHLEYFIKEKLDRFGELEDAMYTDDYYVHHSCISTSLNFGLITPLEVITAIEYTDTAINNKEGFIRQVLGWREYMYQWFWFYKDTIYEENQLNHDRPLPYRFWNPEDSPIQMHCINHTLQTVKDTGYSHHITRLMIIGNFTLLMGYNPHDVNKRFWEMYADAFERVVTPNVLGMSQFADGGKLASKPYISSANYINKMSNYCKNCFYNPKLKQGEKACPFNYLYRNFVNNNKKLFNRQPFIPANLKKKNIEEIKQQSQEFINSII